MDFLVASLTAPWALPFLLLLLVALPLLWFVFCKTTHVLQVAGDQDFTPCGVVDAMPPAEREPARPGPRDDPIPAGLAKSPEQVCYETFRGEAASWRPLWDHLPVHEQMAWNLAADAVILHAVAGIERADDLTEAGRGESEDIVAKQQEAEAEDDGIPQGTEAALFFREAEDGGGLTITAAFYPMLERGNETPAQATAVHALALLKREQQTNGDDDFDDGDDDT